MKAIPTKYRGVQYRSRLEAKWAAFFDQLGWQFEYEPCDFDGWIPDFLIMGAVPIYVEVKPVYEFPQEASDKINDSGCTDYCLIVGLSVCNQSNLQPLSRNCVGWSREHNYHGFGPGKQFWWGPAELGGWGTPRQFGYRHATSDDPFDMVSGECDGYDKYPLEPEELEYVRFLWKKAGNLVQWKGKLAEPGTVGKRHA